MDSQDLRNLHEAYSNVYEQQIGVPLKDASDRAAKEQLKKMIPKGEKIHTTKATLQNASYEPDAFDAILEYLIAEGYADTNENALVIMANMSEEWRNIIIEGGFPGTPSTPRAGDAGTSGLKMIRTTGGGTGYTNKYSSGETLPSGTVNKIMSGNLMVKNNTKKNNNSNIA